MAAVNNNNKETFELLRGSPDSNSGSDISEIVFPARKKRFRRRLKSNPPTQPEDNNNCQGRAKTFTLFLLCFVLICWLLTLTWLAFVLHGELSRLSSRVSQEVAGIQGVPDALQKCHTLSKDLQKNQSEMMGRLRGFSFLLSNLSSVMEKVKSELETVQGQLKSSPDLINNPLLVKELSASLASFGSQFKDLNSTVSTLKEEHGKLDIALGNLVNNVTEMKNNLTGLSNAQVGKGLLTEKAFASEKEAILSVVSQLARNASVINDTLSNKLQWTVQDQSKDHNLIESLREMNENVTARVKTLEGLCAKAEVLDDAKKQSPERAEARSDPSSGTPSSKVLPKDTRQANRTLQNPT